MSKLFFVVSVTIIGLFTGIHAQSSDFEPIRLEDLIDGEYSFRQSRISPNGSHVAWIEPGEGMCLHAFSNNSTECYAWGWAEDDGWQNDNGSAWILISLGHSKEYCDAVMPQVYKELQDNNCIIVIQNMEGIYN